MSESPISDFIKSLNPLSGPPRTGNVVSVTGQPITSVKVISLSFFTDHGLMLNNNTDFSCASSLAKFPKPEFKFGFASSPISHTKNQNVGVEVEFEINPPTAGAVIAQITGTFVPTVGTASLVFDIKWAITGGNKKIKIQSTGPLPDTVTKLAGDIKWSITTPVKTHDAQASWGHIIYVTMDIPVSQSGNEAGITQFRMDKSVAMVQTTGTANAPWAQVPHALVLALMKTIPGYTLIPDATVNSVRAVDHPQYNNSIGGAWNIADFISNKAECQAIVRFIRAVISQVGCPGLAQVMMVYNDPTVNNGNTTLEDDYENPAQTDSSGNPLLGLWHTPFPIINGRKCEALLLGGTPSLVIGTVFDRKNNGRLPGLNPNFFEACLKFTYPVPAAGATPAAGTTKYYPGGVGGAVYDTKELVMSSPPAPPMFFALVWMSEPGGGKPGEELLKLEKVVKKF